MIEIYESQSEFAKKYIEQGRAEGRAQVAAQIVLTILEARGVAVPDQVRECILAQKDLEQLESCLAKAAVASSVVEVLLEIERKVD